ncbi:MAG: hypothetical protein ACI8RZ_000778 [Myxococcota bacterium]|jgi:hypothetical protein
MSATLTARSLSLWITLTGFPEVLPQQDGDALFLGLNGIIPTWTQTAAGTQTHEGQLSQLWQGSDVHDSPQTGVGLQVATGSQAALKGDDTVLALWQEDGQLLLGASRGKVNADRASAGNSRGAAQLADGLHRYHLSHFGYDPSNAEVFRAAKGEIVVVRDLNVDSVVSLQELIAAGLSLENLSVLMHAMGLSEGCWGPLAAAWMRFLNIGKTHLQRHPTDGIPCLNWAGTDLLHWLDAGQPAAWYPQLRAACRGRMVNVAQGLLVNAGFSLDPDSFFGPATARALLAFRQRIGSTETFPGFAESDWDALGAPRRLA